MLDTKPTPTSERPLLLENKRLLITGAASGIGLGAAKLFSALGAHIVAADHDARGLSFLNAVSGTHVADVTSETACDELVAVAASILGGLDGVFHSAGISDVVARAVDVRLDDWQHVMDVNLRGTFLICRAAARIMLQQGYGSIVTISSVNGLGGIPRRHAYGPAKAAVAHLTKSLACEWGSAGVRINALAPAYIRTPMIERLSLEGKVDIGRLERRTPLARLGEVEEVARAGAFLLSDWASYITGAILPVDGGWLAFGGPGDIDSA